METQLNAFAQAAWQANRQDIVINADPSLEVPWIDDNGNVTHTKLDDLEKKAAQSTTLHANIATCVRHAAGRKVSLTKDIRNSATAERVLRPQNNWPHTPPCLTALGAVLEGMSLVKIWDDTGQAGDKPTNPLLEATQSWLEQRFNLYRTTNPARRTVCNVVKIEHSNLGDTHSCIAAVEDRKIPPIQLRLRGAAQPKGKRKFLLERPHETTLPAVEWVEQAANIFATPSARAASYPTSTPKCNTRLFPRQSGWRRRLRSLGAGA